MVDAKVLCDYAARMPFEPWEPPEEAYRELRAVTRRIQALTVQRAREKNRLQAHQASRSASLVVTNDIEVNLRHLTRRIDELTRQVMKVLRQSAALHKAYDRLVSIPGIARKSAILLLGELAMLPEDMSVRQWVRITGDPPMPDSTRSATGRVPPSSSASGSQRSATPVSAGRFICRHSWR